MRSGRSGAGTETLACDLGHLLAALVRFQHARLSAARVSRAEGKRFVCSSERGIGAVGRVFTSAKRGFSLGQRCGKALADRFGFLPITGQRRRAGGKYGAFTSKVLRLALHGGEAACCISRAGLPAANIAAQGADPFLADSKRLSVGGDGSERMLEGGASGNAPQTRGIKCSASGGGIGQGCARRFGLCHVRFGSGALAGEIRGGAVDFAAPRRDTGACGLGLIQRAQGAAFGIGCGSERAFAGGEFGLHARQFGLHCVAGGLGSDGSGAALG